MKSKIIFLILLLSTGFGSIAQTSPQNISTLDSLFNAKKYKEAEVIILKDIEKFIAAKNTDTLPFYIFYYGKAINLNRGYPAAKTALPQITGKLKNTFGKHQVVLNAIVNAAEFYATQDDSQHAYNVLKNALEYFKELDDKTINRIRAHSNMGTYAMRLGNYETSSEHYRITMQLTENEAEPDLRSLFIANNSMGIVMWYASKIDSCVYYFKKAIEVLDKMDDGPMSLYYRKAIIENNIGNAYAEMGRIEESIYFLKESLKNSKRFLAEKEDYPQKENAWRLQFQAMDNLAKTEQEVGNITEAKKLLEYSLQQKESHFGNTSTEVFKSQIAISGLYLQEGDYLRAYNMSKKAIELMDINEGRGTGWEADALYKLARASEELNKKEEAQQYYTEASKLYKNILDENLSIDYLYFLSTSALFYAEMNDREKALEASTIGLNYLRKHNATATLMHIIQLKNLAKVHFLLKDYLKAKSISEEAQGIIISTLGNTEKRTDSLRIELEKPSLILLESKAAYYLLENKDEASLTRLLDKMQESVQVFKKIKTLYTHEKDLSIAVENFREPADFIKLLLKELYEITNKKTYLDSLINFHESNVYYRIQTQFNRQKVIEFAGIPSAIIEEEKQLREELQQTLSDGKNSVAINEYLHTLQQWEAFQQKVKIQYPDYYQAKFASIPFSTIPEFQQKIPAGITAIRFLFGESGINALILGKENEHWVTLESEGVLQLIEELHRTSDPIKTASISYQLYVKLWQPLERYVKDKKVLIIPDGPLFFVSFEMLPVKPSYTLKELVSNALIHRHAMSYHYCLSGLDDKRNSKKLKGFSVHVPGFTETEKQEYLLALKSDTGNADKNYLSLLPLPFNTRLARFIENKLEGSVYYGSNSTSEAFINNAGKNAIIHIGTHGEANNLYPEYSRLIFAKDILHPEADNSLYLHEIFKYDLSSKLAVLTACETGKPGFYPGEGMISLAYAFNYAGSESILTGLWKIDEQVSSIIVQHFYENLRKGMDKDDALQQAKLLYLSEAEGRLLAPKYWAGLVIIGDTSPVEDISNIGNMKMMAYLLIALISLSVFLYFLRKRKEKKIKPATTANF